MDSLTGYHGYGNCGSSGGPDLRRPREPAVVPGAALPRDGVSMCFGFGGSLVLCRSDGRSRLLSISRLLLRKGAPTPDLQSCIRRESKSRTGRVQLSQEEKSRIDAFLSSERARTDESPQTPKDHLRSFRRNCLFELLSLSAARGYIVNSPSDYDAVFAGIRSHVELGVWRCCCEANGKPVEFVSGRSLLGLLCGTYGVSRTLEMHRRGDGVGPDGLWRLDVSWSDRFALSGFCGERELSGCYVDYVGSGLGESGTSSSSRSGLTCRCFERILETLYLSIAQRTEQLEVDCHVLKLWPHYVYSVISSLGASHPGSRSLLASISDGLLLDIRDRRSSLSHHERVFGWQFCTLLLGEYKEIPFGLNPLNLETYTTCMDIVALLTCAANRGGSSPVLGENSVLNKYLASLYLTELGCFERSSRYVECISPHFSGTPDAPGCSVGRECEFLKIRIQERNANLSRETGVGSARALETAPDADSSVHHRQGPPGAKNSSWLVGWISDNIKKAIGSEEERWPGVENTFYFDKEINQWCQRGPDGRRIANEPSRPEDSGAEGGRAPQQQPSPPPPPPLLRPTSNTGGTASIHGGIRSRYVDIFQSKN